KDIVYRCNAAKIKAIVAVGDEIVTNHIEKAMPNSPTVERLISTGPVVPEGWVDFNKGIEEAPKFVRPEFVNRNEDLSLLYFTSGTTGEPKMVAHDFLYPLGHIITGKYWHNLNENSLHLTVADTGWGKAVWGKLYGQWFSGANVFVYDFEKFNAAKLMKQMEKYKITSFCAPPTIYRFMILEDMKKYDLSALKYCTTAGEAMNPSVFARWKELTGIDIKEGFGQTETTLTIGTFPWMKSKPGSMGVPSPEYDIDLINPEGESCKPGEEGEIVIYTDRRRPLGLFREYLYDEELTKEAHNNGVYRTGDMAIRDEDGYYRFVGRADDVIKSSGYRIGPFEVENSLMTHPAVVECAITGVPDPVRGQIVKATVVIADEWKEKIGDDLVKILQNHVKKTTAPYKYPRVIEFVDELPKTISGKIRRVEIRAKHHSTSHAHAC
ncbi:MAG: AMP-binding protein, partial [Muribaculaceae bacterium]|nr:AMP-binding protein [Muribaculaceae bacterium]